MGTKCFEMIAFPTKKYREKLDNVRRSENTENSTGVDVQALMEYSESET